MKQGRMIVIEGLEGSGKSTAMFVLKKILSEHQIPCITTREPGGTILGESVRNLVKHSAVDEPLDPRAELLLFYAARVQLLERVIRPALHQGTWVLSDRSELSSFAYQGGGRGLDAAFLQSLSRTCVGKNQPDLLFFLDISPEMGLQRAGERGLLDRIEQEPLSFFQKVSAAYHQHIKQMDSVVIIDASQPLSEVEESLKAAMMAYLAHNGYA